MRAHAIAAAAAAAWLGVHPAQAAPTMAECLWSQTPPAMRDRLYVAYALGGRDGVLKLAPGPRAQWLAACGVDVRDPEQAEKAGSYAGRLFAAAVIEQLSLQYLQEHGTTVPDLDEAWARLGPRKRAMIRDASQEASGDRRAGPEADRAQGDGEQGDPAAAGGPAGEGAGDDRPIAHRRGDERSGDDRPSDDGPEIHDALIEAAEAAGWRPGSQDEPGLSRYADYFLARGMREEAEAQ